MKHRITISNMALQWLYAMMAKVIVSNRGSAKNINIFFEKVRPIAGDFETAQENFDAQITGHRQIWSETNEKHQERLLVARLTEQGQTPTSKEVAYASPEEQAEVEQKLKSIEKTIDDLRDNRKTLRETKTTVDFSDEEFNFLNTSVDSVLATSSESPKGWIAGDSLVGLTVEVIEALENSEQI